LGHVALGRRKTECALLDIRQKCTYQERVVSQLSQSWFLRLPQARAVWRQLLTELGKGVLEDYVR